MHIHSCSPITPSHHSSFCFVVMLESLQYLKSELPAGQIWLVQVSVIDCMIKALGDCKNHSTNKEVVSLGEQKKTGHAFCFWVVSTCICSSTLGTHTVAFPYLFPWGTERLRPENLLLHEKPLLVQTACSREGPPQQKTESH